MSWETVVIGADLPTPNQMWLITQCEKAFDGWETTLILGAAFSHPESSQLSVGHCPHATFVPEILESWPVSFAGGSRMGPGEGQAGTFALMASTSISMKGPDGSPVNNPFDEAAFRSQVETFLDRHCPRLGSTDKADPGDNDGSSSEELRLSSAKTFQSSLADAGLAGLTYPIKFGGAGLTLRHQELFTQTATNWELPDAPLSISHGMCLPMLNQYGSPRQKATYMPDNIRGATIWCQMFSEPGAGSDVASLASRAELDGDEWLLNGQKVWTSGAHYSDYGLVVARTQPELPKHQGLSMFIVDLRSAGIDIRPLVQISGATGFNEVFFNNVQIPSDNLLGEINQGWNLAVSMLMFERVSIGAGSGSLNTKRHPELIRLSQSLGSNNDPLIRQLLADLVIGEEIKDYIGQRIRSATINGGVPGPEGSIAKLTGALIARQSRDVSMAILGSAGQAWPDDSQTSGDSKKWSSFAVSAAGISIAGGTDEVQRNIIGERVLGLPKEPDQFKGSAWKDTPRN